MSNNFYTVEQIAQMLSIHPKTLQRYIREGKLRAAKIGKSWRINGHDLTRFMEENGNFSDANQKQAPIQERTKASAVIDIQVYGLESATRIMNSLNAAMNLKPPEYGHASLTTQFLESDATLRLTLWGNIQFVSAILDMVDLFLKQTEKEIE